MTLRRCLIIAFDDSEVAWPLAGDENFKGNAILRADHVADPAVREWISQQRVLIDAAVSMLGMETKQ